jgi:hypothetical protein
MLVVAPRSLAFSRESMNVKAKYTRGEMHETRISRPYSDMNNMPDVMDSACAPMGCHG